MSSINKDTSRQVKAGSIVASGDIVMRDVSDFSNVLIVFQGTYATGLVVWFEASMDGANWAQIQTARADTASVAISFSLTANQTVAFDCYVGPFNFFRVRANTWSAPSGSCDVWIVADNSGIDPCPGVTVSGALTTNSNCNGQSAHSAALAGGQGGYPVIVGGQVKAGIDTTMADGDGSYLTLTTGRQVVTKDFGSVETDQQISASVSTTTSPVAVWSAAGVNIRHYITGIQAQNTSATATTLLMQDGAATIWQCNLPANMDKPIVVPFPTPLHGTANTSMNYNFGTAGAAVLLNIQGYRGF